MTVFIDYALGKLCIRTETEETLSFLLDDEPIGFGIKASHTDTTLGWVIDLFKYRYYLGWAKGETPKERPDQLPNTIALGPLELSWERFSWRGLDYRTCTNERGHITSVVVHDHSDERFFNWHVFFFDFDISLIWWRRSPHQAIDIQKPC